MLVPLIDLREAAAEVPCEIDPACNEEKICEIGADPVKYPIDSKPIRENVAKSSSGILD